jgi:hypothetical protein
MINWIDKEYFFLLKKTFLISTFTFCRNSIHFYDFYVAWKNFIFLQILDWNTLCRLNFKNFVKNLGQNLKCIFCNRRIMFQLHLFNVETFCTFWVDFVFHVYTFKREVSIKHSKHQHSHCPNINFIIIDLFFKDLGSHIGGSAAKSIDIFVILTTKA